MPESRQLAAIMFTDIVGYTALMGESESKAYQLLKKNRQVQKPLIDKHGGKWLKEMGDGVLASFQTVSDAVYCAIEIQKVCNAEEDLKLRIGIHLGEVILEDADVFGDGVNIASRIEPLAPVGSIYVSDSVFRNIQNKEGIKVEFVREESLKNVKHPIRIYEINVEKSDLSDLTRSTKQVGSTDTKPGSYRKLVIGISIATVVIIAGYAAYNLFFTISPSSQIASVVESEKSIAVLPFTNMSNDPEQAYFSDGMMEEILNHLFQIGDLLVTSRTSVMRYKGTTKSIPEIARELGVTTILEGSVRKSGKRVRITVQLIDGTTDKHLWSETYDREMDDIFTIQSEVAKSIATTLKAEIQPEVQLRIESQPTDNLEAYNLFLETRKLSNVDIDENKQAIDLLEQVIKLDPDFSMAYFSLGMRLQVGATFYSLEGGMDPQKARLLSRPYFEKAVSINPDNGMAHRFLAYSYLWFDWDFESAEREYKEAKRIYPNYSWTDYLIATGKFDEALQGARYSMDVDPNAALTWVNLINASYFSGMKKEALAYIEEALADSTGNSLRFSIIDISKVYMYLGEYKKALEVVTKARNIMPDVDAPRLSAVEAISHAKLGNRNETDTIIDKLKTHIMDNAGGSPAFYLSMIYAHMGDVDIAFEWLEKSYKEREVEMYWLKVEPPFEPLYSDPRWQVMLDKVGFPD